MELTRDQRIRLGEWALNSWSHFLQMPLMIWIVLRLRQSPDQMKVLVYNQTCLGKALKLLKSETFIIGRLLDHQYSISIAQRSLNLSSRSLTNKKVGPSNYRIISKWVQKIHHSFKLRINNNNRCLLLRRIQLMHWTVAIMLR